MNAVLIFIALIAFIILCRCGVIICDEIISLKSRVELLEAK